ncbi:MAG: MFS transporter, partial [Bdellovibrionota bacterium]
MRKSWLALAAVGCGTFMATLDTSIVNVALPTITLDLDTTLGEVRWVVIAYMLAISCLLLPAGKIADLFGRKKVFQAGYLVFTAGSALCAVSQDIVGLVAARIIQGVGAAFLMANGPAIITQSFPAKSRGTALGIMGMVVSVGLVTGPALGGFLVTHLPWNVIFAVNLPVGILGFVLAQLYVRREHVNPAVAAKRLLTDSFDWLGFGLQSIFLISFIAAVDPPRFQSMVETTHVVVTSSGMVHAGLVRWISAAIAGATGIAFLWQESRSKAPLMDMALFANGTFAFSCLSAFLLFVGF